MAEPRLSASVEEMLEQAIAEGRGFHTGRYIVTYKQGARAEAKQRMRITSDARIASAEDFDESRVDFAGLGSAQSIDLPELGVAVMTAPPDAGAHVAAMVADDASPIEAIEPETFVFIAGDGWRDYLRGFAAATERIRQDLVGGTAAAPTPAVEAGHEEAAAVGATWGLLATRVVPSAFSGRAIKVAVLDTGFDLAHPDFIGRPVISASFVPGQPVQDGHGHGTHCIGTSCGPRAPTGSVPRYGTAYEALIHAGKVLSNSGGSVGGSVLAGMNWAVANRCHVISMSLSGPGGPFLYYTRAGQAALDAGCLMVAAAGNSSRRPAFIAPTEAPANSPTIVSVAAVDEGLHVAVFSCGGKVEIAGPGVNVFSSWPMPVRYRTIGGTSMATPHVAGIAALMAHSNPALRGPALRAALLARARHLPLPPRDVGAGLVQAP